MKHFYILTSSNMIIKQNTKVISDKCNAAGISTSGA